MKFRGMLLAAIVLAALLGTLYWSNRHSAATEGTAKVSPDAAPKILSLNQLDIIRVTIQRRAEAAFALVRSGSGQWQITAPRVLAADQDSVASALSTASLLSSERLVDDKVVDRAAYGLAAPSLQVSFTLKDNKTQKLLIGDQTPTGNAYYVMLDGDPRLFTIPSYDKTALDKTVDDLRDKRLLTADFDKVSQIELIHGNADKKQDITFARNKDEWQILKPGPFRAMGYEVDSLVRALKEAKMDSRSSTDENKAAAAFRSGTPVAIAKISGASGTQELDVRKAKQDYYAKSTAVDGVYKVPANVATSLEKSLDDLRNKKVFDFGYDEPNKIEMHDGAKSYFLTHSGADWWGPDGKKLDSSTVSALLEKLRGLEATKFAESAFTAPAIELTVISNDSRRTEKVSVAKHGDDYVAKRENEPALYELSSLSVQALRDSAANLKPEESSTKK